MLYLGKIISRAKWAVLNSVKVKHGCDFAKFSNAFELGLDNGGICEKVTIVDSTREQWGKMFEKFSRQLKWKVTEDDYYYDAVTISKK